MSFFKKLFGAESFDELRQKADALFAEKKFGEAKLAYDRAVAKGKQASAEGLAHCKARVAASQDAIAEERITHARELAKDGAFELAREEYEAAAQTASDARISERARKEMDDLDRQDARALAQAPSVSEDDEYNGIGGSWEDEQAEEYEGYGEAFRTAILAQHHDDKKAARAGFEKLLESAEDPHYLYFEVGRARLEDDALDEGLEALRAFLESIGPDEGGESRLMAHTLIARVLEKRDDIEGAVTELQAAVDAMDEDPRPYLVLGNFLRVHELTAEAIEVLEAATAVMGELRPDWRVTQELALAHRDAGHDDEARDRLEALLDSFVQRKELQTFPPEGTVALAALHEKQGNLQRAADLYAQLARGFDRPNHVRYLREAARLLLALELTDEAKRMLTRALAIVTEDDVRTELDAQLAELG